MHRALTYVQSPFSGPLKVWNLINLKESASIGQSQHKIGSIFTKHLRSSYIYDQPIFFLHAYLKTFISLTRYRVDKISVAIVSSRNGGGPACDGASSKARRH